MVRAIELPRSIYYILMDPGSKLTVCSLPSVVFIPLRAKRVGR